MVSLLLFVFVFEKVEHLENWSGFESVIDSFGFISVFMFALLLSWSG